ncbi:MAG TPA: ELWxxDGT repeat protein [Thermoanaerobaculia bacterium]|nr:ELWxxDGT repeat protein [Thermoanaerobaculia bacterium]
MLRKFAPGVLVLLLVLALPSAATAVQPAFQVKDIKTTVDSTSPFNFVSDFVELGGALYFTANDGINGFELWRSDGTTSGTHLVKDICPGICSAQPLGLTRFGSSLYFEVSVNSALWKSDGTAAGTVPVFTPPSPLASGFYVQPLAVLGTTLLLTGGDLANQEGLWATDGTADGTSLLKSFPGNGSADPYSSTRSATRSCSAPTTGRTAGSSGKPTAPPPAPCWSRTSFPVRRGRSSAGSPYLPS